jgi:phenylacetate-CoA ligase
MLEGGGTSPKMRAIVSIAEPVSPQMRAAAELAFSCRVTEEYGSVEEVAYALECGEGTLHLWPDAGIVEILDPEGRSCGPGEVGEIVATGLARRAQTYLRYRTGDLAAFGTRPCGCGRHTPTLERVEGRLEDVVVTPEGRRIQRLTPVFNAVPSIESGQFVQRRIGEVVVRVVARNGELSVEERERLARAVQARVGSSSTVSIELVTALPRTRSGKVRTVISEMGLGR